MGFSVSRFWPFFKPKNFGFSILVDVTLGFAVFPFLSIWFSVFGQNASGFSDLLSVVVFGFSYLVSGFASAIMCLNCVRENKFDESTDEDVDISTDENSSQGQQDELGTYTNLLFGVRSRYGRAVRFNNRLLYDTLLKSDSSTFVLPHCTESTVVYHLIRKSVWSEVVVNGTHQTPRGPRRENLLGDICSIYTG